MTKQEVLNPKPKGCDCKWPKVTARNGSGHADTCPVHKRWLRQFNFRSCDMCAPYGDPGYIVNAGQRVPCFQCNPTPVQTPVTSEDDTPPPQLVPDPDFSELIKLTERINRDIGKNHCSDNDSSEYVFEAVMKALYGPPYFDWYNEMVK